MNFTARTARNGNTQLHVGVGATRFKLFQILKAKVCHAIDLIRHPIVAVQRNPVALDAPRFLKRRIPTYGEFLLGVQPVPSHAKLYRYSIDKAIGT